MWCLHYWVQKTDSSPCITSLTCMHLMLASVFSLQYVVICLSLLNSFDTLGLKLAPRRLVERWGLAYGCSISHVGIFQHLPCSAAKAMFPDLPFLLAFSFILAPVRICHCSCLKHKILAHVWVMEECNGCPSIMSSLFCPLSDSKTLVSYSVWYSWYLQICRNRNFLDLIRVG